MIKTLTQTHMKSLTVKLLVTLMLLSSQCTAVLFAVESPSTIRGNTEQSSEILPAFMLSDLRNRRHRSAELQSKIVVLDFWATWCEPCIGEIATYNRFQKKYADQDVRIIGIAVQSGWPKDIRRFANKHNMRFMILAGTDDTVADFNVITFPTTILIAPGWRLHKKYIGAYEGKEAEIEQDIEALLALKR